MKPRLLDLFCGAGGAGMGYHRAGFEVVGVDINPQPRYPFEFHHGDALEYLAAHGHEFDVIHASPPCQAYSEATPIEYRQFHPDLIKPTQELLQKVGKPYVIENVEAARKHLVSPLMLCGSMFGLKVWRHRYFEISPIWIMSPFSCRHAGRPLSIHPGSNARANRDNPIPTIQESRAAMEINWMTGSELSEAIPPAYTEFIGRQLLAALKEQP
jgi:DNA (cytosine-5)-methyltransferase 1